ncbi:Thioredoxin-like protein [Glarea lozoyensis ATCC 20868]|uniref:Thioredoxin-like protein n=1 Tax=Glarea lozoyensis (strain ATCC 20868 / MF5171) TaxID=1116229 RepID=S3CM99_GLAL2|nr:Thioredoxin-like protein [Glarea lozoyensis ATCC 20868]EPE26810.1 Thioredoxin-like protein [Glarea lozoyensis ATCC 20868]
MASTNILRRLALKASPVPSRTFHSSARACIKVGDSIPTVDGLVESSPGNKVNLSEEIKKGKSLIIGVPAAFSPSCSESHIPGYINHQKLKSAGSVFVVAVNDPFVTKAWGATLDPTGSSGIRFLGDPTAKFTEALDLTFDGTAIFGGPRSKRYALEVSDGKVVKIHVEPDNTGLDVSAAEKVLG